MAEQSRRFWRGEEARSTRMQWTGVFFGAVIGLVLARGHVLGAVFGALAGLWFDLNSGRLGAAHAGGARGDGAVSEAEIGAARRVMQELALGPQQIGLAIESFTAGKSADFDLDACVEEL